MITGENSPLEEFIAEENLPLAQLIVYILTAGSK
jgi:hypothetical protein